MKRVKVFLGLTYLPIYVQLVYKYPPSFMLRINIWVVAYFESKKFLKEILSGHYNIKKNAPQKVEKKHPQKLLRNTQFFSSLLPWATQMAQTEELMWFIDQLYIILGPWESWRLLWFIFRLMWPKKLYPIK